MPLSEKVRIEIFIPDFPDPIYGTILEQLGNELTYAYGGSTTIETNGKYRSSDGLISPDRVNLLFSDTPFLWERDRLLIELYAERIRSVVKRALSQEETVLVAVYPVYHAM
ncbi:MAG: hypothetical protein QOH70_1407 [Blastocatellia bacterium]|nr:hypothetical protein [Blastocatellia bacterium]